MKLGESNQLNSLSDLDLFILLCSQQDDNDIYTEFVKRFLPEIKTECAKVCQQRKIDKHVGQQIAHECFENARKYKTFKKDEIKCPDSRKGIIAYLLSIARNLFNDHHNSEKRKNLTVNKTYFDDLFNPTEITDPETLYMIKEHTLEVIKKLSDKERTVLLTDIDYKRQHKYLPDDVNDHLAIELGVKKSSIRKIRERARAKIKKAINEINERK